MLLIALIGAFFAIEGGANIIYWYFYGNGVKRNNFWQIGRILRMVFGIILVIIA